MTEVELFEENRRLSKENTDMKGRIDLYARKFAEASFIGPVDCSATIYCSRKLDVGSGATREDGWESIDISDAYAPDHVHDITELPWPFEDNTFDELRCSHILEHIDRSLLVSVMNEMHRILKPHGLLEIVVPVVCNDQGVMQWQAFADPTHVSFFVPETFAYFLPGYYDDHQKLYGIHTWERLENDPHENVSAIKIYKSADGAIMRIYLVKPMEVAQRTEAVALAGAAI